MVIILLRTVIIYLTLLGCMRIMGKRQLGELELSELVVSVLVADLASLPLQDVGVPLVYGLVSILTLFCLELILSGLMLRFGRLRSAFFGKPCFLMEHGVINQKELRKNRFTIDELTEELRRQSILDMNTVDYAVLETDGSLNVILTPAASPATAGQMHCSITPAGYPYTLISDGRVITENLPQCGKDEAWLRKECARRGVQGPEEVFFLSCTKNGTVYFAKKEAQA